MLANYILELTIILVFVVNLRCERSYSIYSNDGESILLTQSVNGSHAGFFDNITFNNVSFHPSSIGYNLNLYIIGSNINITEFVKWKNSITCDDQTVQTKEVSISVSAQTVDIFYQCSYTLNPSISSSPTLSLTNQYLLWMAGYDQLTWIVEISSSDNQLFSLIVPQQITPNTPSFSTFFVNTSGICTGSNIASIAKISSQCLDCYTSPKSTTIWKPYKISVSNSASFNWYITQQFNAKKMDIKILWGLAIEMYCDIEFDLIPHLVGYTGNMTADTLRDYLNGDVSWPSVHYTIDSIPSIKPISC